MAKSAIIFRSSEENFHGPTFAHFLKRQCCGPFSERMTFLLFRVLVASEGEGIWSSVRQKWRDPLKVGHNKLSGTPLKRLFLASWHIHLKSPATLEFNFLRYSFHQVQQQHFTNWSNSQVTLSVQNSSFWEQKMVLVPHIVSRQILTVSSGNRFAYLFFY